MKEPAMSISFAGKAFVGLLSLGTLSAFELAPPDTRGQTVFLDRLADRVEHAQHLAPATRSTLSDMLVQVRRRQPKADQAADLAPRRQIAVARIERALQRSDQ